METRRPFHVLLFPLPSGQAEHLDREMNHSARLRLSTKPTGSVNPLKVALGGAGAIMFLSDRSGLIGASSDQLITGYKDCAGCGLWNAVDFIRGQTKKEEDELTLAGNKTYWATLQKKNQSCNAPEVRFC